MRAAPPARLTNKPRRRGPMLPTRPPIARSAPSPVVGRGASPRDHLLRALLPDGVQTRRAWAHAPHFQIHAALKPLLLSPRKGLTASPLPPGAQVSVRYSWVLWGAVRRRGCDGAGGRVAALHERSCWCVRVFDWAVGVPRTDLRLAAERNALGSSWVDMASLPLFSAGVPCESTHLVFTRAASRCAPSPTRLLQFGSATSAPHAVRSPFAPIGQCRSLVGRLSLCPELDC